LAQAKVEPKKEEKVEEKVIVKIDPYVALENALVKNENKVSLDVLFLYKQLPVCLEVPDFVDQDYYQKRRKETKEIFFKDNNFQRNRDRNQRQHQSHGHDHNNFEKGTNKQESHDQNPNWRTEVDEDTKRLRL